jgi:AcrR family transcriptional regulator
MTSPNEQAKGPGGRGPGSTATRQRLLRAAAELIAELGWGRVTTRAVAERAGLPHGTVSYHFRGKQELLIEAALVTIEQAFSREELQHLRSVADVLEISAARITDLDAVDPVLSELVIDAMLEARRNPALRERMGAMTVDFRRLLTELVSTEQEHGAISNQAPAAALATLILAAGDGLFLNAMLDPELDVTEALDALRKLLHE